MTRVFLILLFTLQWIASAEQFINPQVMERENRLRILVHPEMDNLMGMRIVILNYEHDRKQNKPLTYSRESEGYRAEKDRYLALKAKTGISDERVDEYRHLRGMLAGEEWVEKEKTDKEERARFAAQNLEKPPALLPGQTAGGVARSNWENALRLEPTNPRAAEYARSTALKLCPDIERAMAEFNEGMKQIDKGEDITGLEHMQAANTLAPGITSLLSLPAIKQFLDNRNRPKTANRRF